MCGGTFSDKIPTKELKTQRSLKKTLWKLLGNLYYDGLGLLKEIRREEVYEYDSRRNIYKGSCNNLVENGSKLYEGETAIRLATGISGGRKSRKSAEVEFGT